MNISKLLILPLLALSSVACADYGILTVFSEKGGLQAQVEYSDSEKVQEFVHEDAALKIVCVKENDQLSMEVSVKNEAGEWEVISKPSLLINADEETTVTINDLTITLKTVKE